MSYRTNDFVCLECSTVFESIWKKPPGQTEEAYSAWEGQVTCPSCGSTSLEKKLAAPPPAAFSLLDKEGRAASLKKRSFEHSKKLMKQDADKHRATISRKINAIKG